MVNIEPVQDLHGYDNPWPAGGGSQLIPYPYNVSGTVSNNDVTFVIEGEGKIKATGTASPGAAQVDLVPNTSGSRLPLENGAKYTISGFAVSNTTRVGAVVYNSQNTAIAEYWSTTGSTTFTVPNDSETYETRVVCRVNQGETVSNAIFAPKIEKGETATAFSTYSNICPISGWTGANVTRTGFNVWDEEWELGSYDAEDGSKYPYNDRIRSKNKTPVLPNTTYYFRTTSTTYKYLFYYRENGDYISYKAADSNTTFATPEGCYYLTFGLHPYYGETYNHDICINLSDPAKNGTYEPGHVVTIPISWQSEAGTVYGGSYEVIGGALESIYEHLQLTGKDVAAFDTVTNQVVFKDISGPLQKPTTIPICNMYKVVAVQYWSNMTDGSIAFHPSNGKTIHVKDSSVTSYSEAVTKYDGTPIDLVYVLASPVDYTVEGHELQTLYGQNNIWADCGDVSITDGGYLTRVIEHADRLEESLGFYYDKDV